jgi:hypothetical protein
MTQEQFDDLISSSILRESHMISMREGQTLMNILYDIDRELYQDVILNGCDPFYDDEKIPAFLDFLKTNYQGYHRTSGDVAVEGDFSR